MLSEKEEILLEGWTYRLNIEQSKLQEDGQETIDTANMCLWTFVDTIKLALDYALCQHAVYSQVSASFSFLKARHVC